MPCRSACRLFIHLAFTYSIGPSNIVWSELGPAPPFPPMTMLEVKRSRAPTLVREAMIWENWQLVTNEPVEFGEVLKFKTAWKIGIILEDSIEYTRINKGKTEGCLTCNRWDLQTLGSQPIRPKNPPDHGSEVGQKNKSQHFCSYFFLVLFILALVVWAL